MPSIAHPDPTAVLDSTAKFFRVMDKAGAPFGAFTTPMQSVAKRRNLAEYLNLGCPKVKDDGTVDTTPSEQDFARLILGDDFITPEEVTTARGLVYTDEQLAGLDESFPSLEFIAQCRGNNEMLIPAPPEALSLLGVREPKRELFRSEEGGWYADPKETFAREDLTDVATWLAVRKDIVPNSTAKKWKEQLPLLSEEEHVPNAAALAWALTTYKEVRGVWLMTDFWARTSSVRSGGLRVILRACDGQLSVNDYSDGNRDGVVGVSSGRKS